jgi:hypothetical protein
VPSDSPNDDPSPSVRPGSSPRRPGFRPRRRTRRRRVGALSLLAFATLVVLAAVTRTRWFAAQVADRVGRVVRDATGLEVSWQSVGFRFWTFTVRINGIEVRRPGTARLVRVDALDIGVAPNDVLHGLVRPTSIAVDGAEVDLRFVRREGRIVLENGPESRGGGGSSSTELPFRDLALSDVRVRLQHPQVGSVALDDVDVDLLNRPGQPLRVGLLVGGGDLRTPWFNGPVQRVEARLAVGLQGPGPDLDIASATVVVGPPKVETSAQVRGLRLRPRRGPLRSALALRARLWRARALPPTRGACT